MLEEAAARLPAPAISRERKPSPLGATGEGGLETLLHVSPQSPGRFYLRWIRRESRLQAAAETPGLEFQAQVRLGAPSLAPRYRPQSQRLVSHQSARSTVASRGGAYQGAAAGGGSPTGALGGCGAPSFSAAEEGPASWRPLSRRPGRGAQGGRVAAAESRAAAGAALPSRHLVRASREAWPSPDRTIGLGRGRDRAGAG